MSFIYRHFFINNLIDLYRCYFYQHNATNAWSFTTDLIDIISKRQCKSSTNCSPCNFKVTLHAHMHGNASHLRTVGLVIFKWLSMHICMAMANLQQNRRGPSNLHLWSIIWKICLVFLGFSRRFPTLKKSQSKK